MEPEARWLASLWTALCYQRFLLARPDGAGGIAFCWDEDACRLLDWHPDLETQPRKRHWTFSDVVGRSGDSILRAYRFADGVADVDLDWYEGDAVVRIRIPTTVVEAGEIPVSEQGHICFLEVTDLAEALRQEHGHYVPAGSFAQVMQDARRGLTLAYGKSNREARYLVSLRGYTRHFSCLVHHLDAITVEELP